MKRAFTLMLTVVILLALVACGETVENNSSQNEPSESIGITPDSDSVAEDTSSADSTTTKESNSDNQSTKSGKSNSSATESTKTPESSVSESSSSTKSSTPKPIENSTPATSLAPKEDNTLINIKISVNGSVFSAKLYGNDTSRALTAKFPMTLNMSELNGNEKYYYLPDTLPADSQRVGSINKGDLMLYGSDCLVLFYENFSTSYSYTKIGYIEDVSGFAAALGSGSVQVTFALGS